jgi:molybdopterin synthase sulfur carrier subunit
MPSVATVQLTNHLYAFFPALERRELDVPGATVAEVVQGMEALAPGFAFYVCDELGRLRQHVNIYVGDERVSDRATLSDPVEPGSRVLILQALSGG